MTDTNKERDLWRMREEFEAYWIKAGNSRTSLATWPASSNVPESSHYAYIMAGTRYAWAAFQAGRASLSAEAGPVAEVISTNGLEAEFTCEMLYGHVPAVGSLIYLAAPAQAPAPGWVSVDERLPEPGMPVLLDISKKFPIRAMWAAKGTVEASSECADDWSEYDEATDTYYCPEGWYEWNEQEETHWRVTGTPRGWLALPLPAAPSSGKE